MKYRHRSYTFIVFSGVMLPGFKKAHDSQRQMELRYCLRSGQGHWTDNKKKGNPKPGGTNYLKTFSTM